MNKMLLGLGAVGAGVIAFFALKKPAAAATPQAPPAPGPAPAPGPLVAPPAPPTVTPGIPVPALPITPEAALVFVHSLTSLHLKQDQYHRGRLTLQDFGLPPFNARSTEEEIGKGLVALGFKDVRVFMNVSDLPTTPDFPGGPWPMATAQNTSAGTRWFQGQWGGPTMDIIKPPGVDMVWVTQSPTLFASRQAQAASTSGMCVSGMRMTG